MKQQAYQTTSLTEGIVAFVHFARSHGLNIGLPETKDALLAADLGLLINRELFKDALKTIFCKSPEEEKVFEKIFLLYWDTNPIDLQERKGKATVQGLVEKKANATLVMLGRGDKQEQETDAKNVSGANEKERLKKTDLAQVKETDAAQLEAIARKLFREMAVRMRRRMKSSTKKGRINLRRTIRHSISYGGEPIELYRKSQKPKKQRLIVLLDVSGSMDKYSFYLLRFICALKEQFRQLEAFLFSTQLLRVTKALQLNRIDQILQTVSDQAEHWSGGTRIGTCLGKFNERYGKLLLNGSPIVLILSDGLDTGTPEELQKELKYIKGKARKLIWLNPLKGMKGYAPIAKGMSAALPAIDAFRSAHNLESLLELETILQDA
ncbi:VWA domain-containing protein [Flavihumibacter cheonanensis]|uniref:vWA domain-containing protein n=1 Tax=Flavihumibacter cheonanensis TaxID=1442385 RepID=UPI001EF95BB4|nr:VWA domain-containing protein [Flavihumibacter cheonanensis]MCG7753977.1 VWA domain-containing protein [Flavihumibacter cheonanensis]